MLSNLRTSRPRTSQAASW